MRYLKEYLAALFQDTVEKQLEDIPKDYLLNRTVCDFAETVRWWMANSHYSPEDISRFFFSGMPCR